MIDDCTFYSPTGRSRMILRLVMASHRPPSERHDLGSKQPLILSLKEEIPRY